MQDAWWMPACCGIICNVIYLWTHSPALQEARAREKDEKQPLKAPDGQTVPREELSSCFYQQAEGNS